MLLLGASGGGRGPPHRSREAEAIEEQAAPGRDHRQQTLPREGFHCQ